MLLRWKLNITFLRDALEKELRDILMKKIVLDNQTSLTVLMVLTKPIRILTILTKPIRGKKHSDEFTVLKIELIVLEILKFS